MPDWDQRMLPVRPLVAAVAATALFATVARADQGVIDDVSVSYSLMRIDSAILGGQAQNPLFFRHNLGVQLGIDDLTLGLVYQRTDKGRVNDLGESENGLMLTVGWERALLPFVSGGFFGRVGLTSIGSEAQPLYAEDTDLTLKLTFFDADGWGDHVADAVYPSMYVATNANRFGRVQGIVGAGFWWRGFGMYLTGLYAFNGVEDLATSGADRAHAFAMLKNAGVTVSASYDHEISPGAALRVELRRNIPIQNAGADTSAVVTLRWFFNAEESL